MKLRLTSLSPDEHCDSLDLQNAVTRTQFIHLCVFGTGPPYWAPELAVGSSSPSKLIEQDFKMTSLVHTGCRPVVMGGC